MQDSFRHGNRIKTKYGVKNENDQVKEHVEQDRNNLETNIIVYNEGREETKLYKAKT
jgi:hypothetical protein